MKKRTAPDSGQIKGSETLDSLTYETLITCDPFYHGEIIAGWTGRKKKIQQIVFNEIHTSNNSLLIIKNTNEQIKRIEERIKDPHTTGVIILTDQQVYVESFLIDLANKLEKPLLTLMHHNEQHVTEKFNQILYLSKNNLLNILQNEMTSYWLQLFFKTNIQHVAKKLTTLLGQDVFFLTEKKKFIELLSSDYTEKDFSNLETIEDYASTFSSLFTLVRNAKWEFYSYKILDPNGKTIGYFLVKNKEHLTNAQIQLLQTMTPTILAWRHQTEVTRQFHLKYTDQFMFDILHNNLENESRMIEVGNIMGMEFTPNACVLAINLESHQAITKDVHLGIQEVLTTHNSLKMNVYTTYLSHRIVAILSPSGVSEIEKTNLIHWLKVIQNQISEKFPYIQATIGIGRAYPSIIDIYKSFQEAKIALQMNVYGLGTDGIIHYEDIGFVRLLSYIHIDLLEDFSKQYIGKLEKHDQENETDFVYTLSTYCSQSGDIVKTADLLFIHSNTLRQRLRKIQSILGIQLNDYTDLVNVLISLKISQSIDV